MIVLSSGDVFLVRFPAIFDVINACTNGRYGHICVQKFLSYAENRHERHLQSSKIVTQIQKACPIFQSASDLDY